MQGNYYSDVYNYLEIKLWKCQNSSSSAKCQNQTAIDNYINNQTLSFAFVNSLFDSTNFGNPVEFFIDDSLFFNLDASKSKYANFYVQLSEASL